MVKADALDREIGSFERQLHVSVGVVDRHVSRAGIVSAEHQLLRFRRRRTYEHEANPSSDALAEQAVHQRVHARVGRAQPLRQRNYGVVQNAHLLAIVFRGVEIHLELHGVQRQPRQSEQQNDDHQHLHDPYLGFENNTPLSGDPGRIPVPHSQSDHDVAHHYEHERNGVTQEEHCHEELSILSRLRPGLVADVEDLDAGAVLLLRVVERPRNHDGQRHAPYHHDYHPRYPHRHLETKDETDGNESEIKRSNRLK